MPNAEYMNPAGIADPSPSGFTAVVKAGGTVYIAGMVSQDEQGNVVGAGDAEAQTRQIWRNIGVAVAAAGGSLADIVKTTTYVTGIEHAAAVRKVRGELFAAVAVRVMELAGRIGALDGQGEPEDADEATSYRALGARVAALGERVTALDGQVGAIGFARGRNYVRRAKRVLVMRWTDELTARVTALEAAGADGGGP